MSIQSRMQNESQNPGRTNLPAWSALQAHQKEIQHMHMARMFAENPDRAKTFSLTLDNIFFDYSKNKITNKTLGLLYDLARACNLESWRDKMFAGEKINNTEGRAVLHTALREKKPAPDVKETLDRMQAFTEEQAAPFQDIVNIGIGGSDLGPRLVCEALRPYAKGKHRVHFVSNVDPGHIMQVLQDLDPKTTMFIVSSKSFTTQETLTNAHTARNWLKKSLKKSKVEEHFIAVTGHEERAQDFGIKTQNIFPLPEWVGGRYSLWSAIGLPITLFIGFESFRQLLAGAGAADQHFKSAPLEENIPAILGMLGIWYRNFWDYACHALLPYDYNLRSMPIYIQQLDMESNGKCVDRTGQRVNYKTAPVIFGQAGTNGQHAFHQLLHQGTEIVPCDFIASIKSHTPVGDHHEKLLANALAQSEALMRGSENESEPHRNFDGNRPSNFFLLDKLSPYNLGMLLAFYEHKIFVQSVIWNLNSFDQFGVELGKILSRDILESLKGEADFTGDASTNSIMEKIRHSG